MTDTEEQRKALDVVTHLVKAAIGESKLWVKSYEMDYPARHLHGVDLDVPRVKIVVDGDVTGPLTLSGPLAQRVMKVMSAYRLPPELEAVKAENAVLKARLAQLHALSGPESES